MKQRLLLLLLHIFLLFTVFSSQKKPDSILIYDIKCFSFFWFVLRFFDKKSNDVFFKKSSENWAALTFYQGKMTTGFVILLFCLQESTIIVDFFSFILFFLIEIGRRLPPIKQLTRVGGTAGNYEPDVWFLIYSCFENCCY